MKERHFMFDDLSAVHRVRSSSSRHAFTMIELLTVVAIIMILAGMLLPTLAKTKAKGHSVSCLNNLRQLQFASIQYASDEKDALPANQWSVVNWQDDCPEGGQTTADSWVLGFATTDKDTWNIQNGSLFPYVNAAAAYHCPSDKSTVDSYPKIQRKRSY